MSFRNKMSREKKLYARWLKHHMTPAEQALWQAVRRKRFGISAHRQKPMLGYIADFWFPKAKLVVEVDGSSHEDKTEYDAHRDEVMRNHGFEVIRFTNQQVLCELPVVLEKIGRSIAVLMNC